MRSGLLFVLATGCTSPDDPVPSAPAEDVGVPRASACDAGDYAVEVGADGSQRVRTARYDLTVDAAADAVDLARLLEAAGLAYAEDLGAEPAVDGPLEVVLYPDEDAWVDGLAARGIAAPRGAGGYFDPGTRLASLYRQPTAYFTQMLLLHEAYHQFHLLARTRADALPTWYVEGLAEWASRHDWDGRCVTVGAEPRGTLEDSWAAAAGQAERGSDLAGWIADDAFPGRPEMMTFVHQQEHEAHDDWRAFREGMDFGAPTALSPDDDAWSAHVAANQEPLRPVWVEWLHRTPTVMRGSSGGGISVILYKQTPARVAFEVPLGEAAWAGGVYGWSDDGFDVVLVDGAGVVTRWTYTATENTWEPIDQLDAPGDTLRWEQEGDTLLLDGRALDIAPRLPAAAGFAVYDGQVAFTTLEE